MHAQGLETFKNTSRVLVDDALCSANPFDLLNMVCQSGFPTTPMYKLSVEDVLGHWDITIDTFWGAVREVSPALQKAAGLKKTLREMASRVERAATAAEQAMACAVDAQAALAASVETIAALDARVKELEGENIKGGDTTEEEYATPAVKRGRYDPSPDRVSLCSTEEESVTDSDESSNGSTVSSFPNPPPPHTTYPPASFKLNQTQHNTFPHPSLHNITLSSR
jgi:hypothetical protein